MSAQNLYRGVTLNLNKTEMKGTMTARTNEADDETASQHTAMRMTREQYLQSRAAS